MIINLRGTSASGKSTIVRNLLYAKGNAFRNIYGVLGPRSPEAVHLPDRNLYALGPYPVAGCDSVVGKLGVQGVIDLLEKYSAKGHVIFEALIISSMYGAIGEWLRLHPPVIIALLDVSLAECLAGLKERQGDRQKKAKTIEAHYHNTFKVADDMNFNKKMRVEMLKREGAVEKILSWLPHA
jgi:hypothetical protein